MVKVPKYYHGVKSTGGGGGGGGGVGIGWLMVYQLEFLLSLHQQCNLPCRFQLRYLKSALHQRPKRVVIHPWAKLDTEVTVTPDMASLTLKEHPIVIMVGQVERSGWRRDQEKVLAGLI